MAEDKNKTLKRGLSALLGEEASSSGEIQNASFSRIDKISPSRFQARTDISTENLEDLAASIRSQGVIQPLIVRKTASGEFELVAGERRLRAAKMVGLSEVPIVVKDLSDEEIIKMGLIENLQREDLNPVEEARGYDRLKREFELTQDEIAKATGKARSTIANSMRILSLSPKILDMISQGALEKGHAKILSGLDTTKAEKLAEAISQKKLTVRQAEALLKPAKKATKIKVKDRDTLNIEDEISGNFGHKTEIETKTTKTGKVSIFYHSPDELETIIQKLLKL